MQGYHRAGFKDKVRGSLLPFRSINVTVVSAIIVNTPTIKSISTISLSSSNEKNGIALLLVQQFPT